MNKERYVLVRLLNGFAKPLTYAVPASVGGDPLQVGAVIEVPLRNKQLPAMVLKVLSERPAVSYQIRALTRIQVLPGGGAYHEYLESLAALYDSSAFHFYRRLRSFLLNGELIDEQEADEGDHEPYHRQATVQLTDEQAAAVAAVMPAVLEPRFHPTLLHGVTGSGKTEVYLALVRATIMAGRSVIFLAPEVSLARRFEQLFARDLGDGVAVYGFYSGVTKTARQALWQHMLAGKPMVIVGVHLPILLPCANLGLILVDEEHETGFEEKQHPRVNSKYAALLRARQYKLPIVLGSATPSVATWYHARQQGWTICHLTKRFGGAIAQIEHVVLGPARTRRHFWFSEVLLAAITKTLAAGEQIIVYLNRRGYSGCAQCTECGHRFMCSDCAVSLTVHLSATQEAELHCHYCARTQTVPPRCPTCKVSGSELCFKGIGTQQVVVQLQKLFPHARIARADTDVSRRKKAWAETIEQFDAHEIDIMVGTQIITKGYHFPKVTLVGVLWGDSGLHFPVYNAQEVALQQLLQVAGRAGRVLAGSRVIVQSFADHEIFKFLSEERYEEFCKQELMAREQSHYPPCGRLLVIELKSTNEVLLLQESGLMAARLRTALGECGNVLGPASPLVAKVARTHIRQILLKGETFTPLYDAVRSIDRKNLKCELTISPY